MEEEVEFNGYLYAKEPLLWLSREACRQTGGWKKRDDVPTPTADDLRKGESTEAHKKMIRQFINDIRSDPKIAPWATGCNMFKKGPYLLKSGNLTFPGGWMVILPLVDEDAEDPAELPIVKVQPYMSNKKKKVTWNPRLLIPIPPNDKLMLEGGEIMFETLQFIPNSGGGNKSELPKETQPDAEGE